MSITRWLMALPMIALCSLIVTQGALADTPYLACDGMCSKCDDLDSSKKTIDSEGGWNDLNLVEKPWKPLMASVTYYNQIDPPDQPQPGKCGKQNLKEYKTDKGWVTTAAIPLGWWPKSTYGNCDDCISCNGNGMAVDKNGAELCFKLTNSQSEDVYVKIMDSCGGNCIGSDGTCNTTQDCAGLAQQSGTGYDIDKRCSRAELKKDYWQAIDDPCRTTTPGTYNDWCAGGKGDGLHIDIGDSQNGSAFYQAWIGTDSPWSIETVRVDCADVPPNPE